MSALVTAESICRSVAEYYGVPMSVLLAPRASESVWLRAIVVALAEAYPTITYNSLARVLARNHSTILALRGREVIRGRPVVLEPDLVRLVAIGVAAHRQRAVCPACQGTGIVEVGAA